MLTKPGLYLHYQNNNKKIKTMYVKTWVPSEITGQFVEYYNVVSITISSDDYANVHFAILHFDDLTSLTVDLCDIREITQ